MLQTQHTQQAEANATPGPEGQLIRKEGGQVRVPSLHVRDGPDKPFRGVKLYVPGRTQIQFFKRFIREFMAVYKYNTLMMEMNACMRLDRLPELNAGWVEMGRDTNVSRKNSPSSRTCWTRCSKSFSPRSTFTSGVTKRAERRYEGLDILEATGDAW